MHQVCALSNIDENYYELDINFHVVTFMFNGTVVTLPYLLYHDEISIGTTATSGVLTCIVGSNTSVWRDVSASPVNTSSPLQSTTSGLMSRLFRTNNPIPNVAQYNGLWSCIQADRKAFGYIGIYNRGKLTYTFSRMLV